MKVKAQMAMVFNLDKCIGCNTCTVACKNIWTNREGAEYMWWNNVETKPGIGYPKRWENQDVYDGGWVVKGGKPRLRYGSRFYMMINLFFNPKMPQMADYYGTGPYTFTYEDLHDTKPLTQQPVGRPKSMITGKEDVDLTWGVNWEDNAGGAHETGKLDGNFKDLSPADHAKNLKFDDSWFFYLPRICNHCMNPACVAACPSGAAYKREEDGIVLIDQNRCRAWRMCVSSCPYKKPYLNWRTGKMEKCILCYPRIETGQVPACFHSCVGKIRYLGPILYDMDRVSEVASVPDQELVERQREIILDPSDPEVCRAAERDGIGEAWLDACRRSPVFKLVKEWEIALPLHSEFRTLPSLFYVPPESPIRTAGGKVLDMLRGNGHNTPAPALDDFRVPIQYLARLLAAGNEGLVRKALARLLAVREFRREERVNGKTDSSILDAVGLSVEEARQMHRLLALAFYHERFVVPTTHRERTANAPYIERGFAGFGEMAPMAEPRRRSTFYGGRTEVGS